MPTFQGRNQGEGEKVFTLTQTWHLSLQSFSLFLVPVLYPALLFFPLNNTLEWRTILLLTPLLPPSNSIQGSCEQGLEPLLTALSSLFSFFSATISPSRPLFFWILKPNNKLCVVKIPPEQFKRCAIHCRNRQDVFKREILLTRLFIYYLKKEKKNVPEFCNAVCSLYLFSFGCSNKIINKKMKYPKKNCSS